MLLESIILPLNYTPFCRSVTPLLLSFFVDGVFPAPIAVFFQFQFLLPGFFGFVGKIVDSFACLALQFNVWWFFGGHIKR